MNLVDLLIEMRSRQASDLFLTTGKRPRIRRLGCLQELPAPPVAEEDLRQFMDAHLSPGAGDRLERERDLDVGVSLSGTERFRLNLAYQKGQLSMAVRRVPSGALTFAELRLPAVVRDLAERARGLVLITGATGSGKSTTMAAMLHHINTTAARHIVTIEDPIEFVHQDDKSLVSQREIGTDSLSFASALKHVVRQNPDVILIGEMRDLETIQTAISAAMTGHLVISTLHTVDVSQTLERIINYFPMGLRDQVALDLSLALAGIVSQRLLPGRDEAGLVPVFEILVATPLVRRIVAERKLDEIDDVLKAGVADGMTTFTRSLVQRCRDELLAPDVAVTGATNRDEFLLAAEGMETGIDTLRNQDLGSSPTTLSMKSLLNEAVKHGASDLLLTVGSPPMLRIAGSLRAFDLLPLTSVETRRLLFSVLTAAQRGQFEAEKEIDFALSVSVEMEADAQRDHRFRVNGFYQKGSIACALRVIPQAIGDPESLMIPAAVMSLAQRRQGLVLVTGPTGHGKTTTLACLIAAINAQRACHIITIEDPIEILHASREAVIEQREVHADTKSFANALKYILRQDPDVILIGEMRDRETTAAALTAAETGHLVFATLHTNDAAQSVDRIIDIFPGDQQSQVRSQLAACLEAVISQRLLPRKDDETKRVAAFEVMLGNTAVRSLIREQRTHQLLSALETGAKDGMITLDKALLNLYRRDLISAATFKAVARDPSAL